MLYAINDDKDKISPKKEIIAYCPLCKERVTAVCGDIYIHHWRHTKSKNCDSWKENETEWHRNWKRKFPKEWQEVIIIKEGEKHISDIKTKNGLILEFQNSSISPNIIRVREEFYINMIWLINAKMFRNNLSINSCSAIKLNKIEREYNFGSIDKTRINKYLISHSKRLDKLYKDKKLYSSEEFNLEKEKLKIEYNKDKELANFTLKDKYEEEKEKTKELERIFTLKWQHKRTSWDNAICPIYFDFGDHIYKLLQNGNVEQFTVDEFIKIVYNG